MTSKASIALPRGARLEWADTHWPSDMRYHWTIRGPDGVALRQGLVPSLRDVVDAVQVWLGLA